MIGKQKTGHDLMSRDGGLRRFYLEILALKVLERNSDGALHIACLLF